MSDLLTGKVYPGYSANVKDPKMHVTLSVDIFKEPRFDNMKLVEKLARKVNEIKL